MNKKEYNKLYSKKNRPKFRKAYRKHWKKNKDSIREKNKLYRRINKRKGDNSRLKQKYGITVEIKEKMCLCQNNKCAICGKLFNNSFDTHVDHSHASKKVRGILCRKCNLGLGCFADNPLILASAISYLQKYD